MDLDEQTRQRVSQLYGLWSEDTYFDESTRRELLSLSEEEIADRFYTDLAFGTAGLRGLIGAGTNRMNIYVVRQVTQALSDTIRECGPEACARGVVIAHDSRHFADVFARETARILAANGIRAYLFDALRPTPELSFAVRYLHCIAGVMVTASHNPQKYNGYKVYWEDGSQISPEKAVQILRHRQAQTEWSIAVPQDGTWEERFLTLVGPDLDQAYQAAVLSTLVTPDLIKDWGHELSIVYSPLHGAGNKPTQEVLRRAGFTSLHVVPEQQEPDGSFPTVPSPNPENPEAFAMARALAERTDADLILLSDPDGDRLGVQVRDQTGVFRNLTGNQIGILLLHYLIEQKQAQGSLPADAVVVKTIASTDLADAMAAAAGVEVRDVHVGFKFIGEQILEMETSGKGHFLLGFEESLGSLAGSYTRDKDAVGAAALLSEAALFYKVKRGQSLWQVLESVYARFGYYEDAQMSITLGGLEGRRKIGEIMERMRRSPLQTLAGYPVRTVEDYQAQSERSLAEGKESPIDLPSADVLRFSLQGGGYVMVRPSGTEPKIKFYFSLKSSDAVAGRNLLAQAEQEFLAPVADLLI